MAASFVALVLPSCGSSEGEEPQPSIRATLAKALKAAADDDVRTLCGLLSEDGKIVIGLAQHESLPIECRIDTKRYTDSLQPYGNGAKPVLIQVTQSSPDRALATYQLPAGMRTAIRLRREDNAWKLDGLFDAPLSRAQLRSAFDHPRLPGDNELAASSELPPPVAPGRVVVRTAGGRRCPPVALDRFPVLSGGCVTKTTGRGVRLSIHTPFGFMTFARCRIDYELRTDGRGRAWIADFRIQGASPCLDITSCRDSRERIVPWQARIDAAAGGWRLDVRDVCLESCLGDFKGRSPLSLTAGARGLRAGFGSTVGVSGMRIDGSAASRPPVTLTLEPVRG